MHKVQGTLQVQVLAEQRPAWLVAEPSSPELGAAVKAHKIIYCWQGTMTRQMRFAAAFGTPAVCCRSYLLHLECLIVSCTGTEVWTAHFRTQRQPGPRHSRGVCQAWLPSPRCPSSAAHPSSLQKVTGAAASATAKHTDTPKRSLKTMVPP